jgi:CHAT domain-containing protein
VLSACETNVGIRRAGLGIQSLQAALHAAGAQSAITSLWKVDDDAARELMTTFYTLYWGERGLTKARALWEAQTLMRARWPLREWSGWVLTGDPR